MCFTIRHGKRLGETLKLPRLSRVSGAGLGQRLGSCNVSSRILNVSISSRTKFWTSRSRTHGSRVSSRSRLRRSRAHPCRLSYASPAWWGFTSTDDKNRLEAFVRRSVKLGYRASSSATFAIICDDADNKLFSHITGNSQHLLHPLLPPEREQHYSLRDRSQLPTCWS